MNISLCSQQVINSEMSCAKVLLHIASTELIYIRDSKIESKYHGLRTCPPV